MKRAHIPLKEKLAAALYELGCEQGAFVHNPDFSALFRNRATAVEVIAQFDFDHVVYHSTSGPDKWWNLTPLLRADHREKTKRDLGVIAKSKRIQRKHARHVSVMATKAGIAIDSDGDFRATMYGAAGGGGKHAGTEDSRSDGARSAQAKRGRAKAGRRLSRPRKPLSRDSRIARPRG